MLVGAGKWMGFGEAGESRASSLRWYGSSGGSEDRSEFMGYWLRMGAGETWVVGLDVAWACDML